MKKILIATALLIFCVSACNDEKESETDNVTLQLMASIDANSALLDSALKHTTAILEGGEIIKRNIEQAEKKEEFIKSMNSVMKPVFDAAVKHIFIKKQSPALAIQRQENFISYVVKNDDNHIEAYAAEIERRVEKTKDKGDWIAIESYSWPSTSQVPTEQAAVNFSKMTRTLEIYGLIITHQQTADLDNAIDLHIKSNEDTRVAVGLLLPAVQMAREAARRHRSLMDVVFADNVFNTKPTNMPLLLQHQRAAAFLGGLDILISGDFDSTNEKTLSTDVLRSIYENMMTELWSQTWDHAHN